MHIDYAAQKWLRIHRGARVHSDSWTSTQGTYDTNSFNVDLFAWLFQVGANESLVAVARAVWTESARSPVSVLLNHHSSDGRLSYVQQSDHGSLPDHNSFPIALGIATPQALPRTRHWR